jgi:hypothetical protein
MALHERRNPLLFETDGSFNPGWALFILFSGLGALGSVVAFLVAIANEKAWMVVIAAFSFIAFAMLCTAIIVVPIAKAKLLAPALPAAVKAISAAAAFEPHEWATGEPDAGIM